MISWKIIVAFLAGYYIARMDAYFIYKRKQKILKELDEIKDKQEEIKEKQENLQWKLKENG